MRQPAQGPQQFQAGLGSRLRLGRSAPRHAVDIDLPRGGLDVEAVGLRQRYVRATFQRHRPVLRTVAEAGPAQVELRDVECKTALAAPGVPRLLFRRHGGERVAPLIARTAVGQAQLSVHHQIHRHGHRRHPGAQAQAAGRIAPARCQHNGCPLPLEARHAVELERPQHRTGGDQQIDVLDLVAPAVARVDHRQLAVADRRLLQHDEVRVDLGDQPVARPGGEPVEPPFLVDGQAQVRPIHRQVDDPHFALEQRRQLDAHLEALHRQQRVLGLADTHIGKGQGRRRQQAHLRLAHHRHPVAQQLLAIALERGAIGRPVDEERPDERCQQHRDHGYADRDVDRIQRPGLPFARSLAALNPTGRSCPD